MIIGGGIVALIVFFAILSIVPMGLWITAKTAGAGISMMQLVAMRLRKVPPPLIVNTRINALKAGLNVSTNQLEAHYLAGGHVELVVNALISADKAGIELDFDRAAAIDLAGRHVLEAVQMSVNPRVITTPKIPGVAKDGIQLLAVARITVRTNLDRIVGGAGEETILARVGEGVVSTIGAAHDYKLVMENPDSISKTVLNKALDAGTAFEILSIDIADVEVGANIGAKLQAEQAEATKLVAQAQAESRRASAVALEQEMKARVQEMRAKLVEAEAQVPTAMAEALRAGRLGVMDYYQMKNVVADTEMRTAFSDMGGGKGPKGAATMADRPAERARADGRAALVPRRPRRVPAPLRPAHADGTATRAPPLRGRMPILPHRPSILPFPAAGEGRERPMNECKVLIWVIVTLFKLIFWIVRGVFRSDPRPAFASSPAA